MAAITDALSSSSKKELAVLSRSRRARMLSLLGRSALGLLVVLFVLTAIFGRSSGDVTAPAKRSLLLYSGGWGNDLVSQYESYRQWLSRYGTGGETLIFDKASSLIFSGASFFSRNQDLSSSLFSKGVIALFFGVNRLIFVLVACWRVWFVVMLIFAYRGFSKLKVYRGADLLGATGNGRLFFSGARAGLDNLTPTGTPDVHVPGLASVRAVPEALAKSSILGELLSEWGVANHTNLALAAIICQHQSLPAYVAEAQEQALLESSFGGADLLPNCCTILREILKLHQYYAESLDLSNDPQHQLEGVRRKELIGSDSSRSMRGIDMYQNAQVLAFAMDRVLTPKMRRDLSTLSRTVLASIILAHEAGKSMAFGFEGGRWARRSNYPELYARAVLHSIPAYGGDYDFDTRMTIRRALIYGSRNSSFGPVLFPVDLNDQSRAARQWVELLLAAPHRLQAAADEVEIFGLISELHKSWEQLFFDKLMVAASEVRENVFSTQANLLFIPMTGIAALMRRVIKPSVFRRLHELMILVSQRQSLERLGNDPSEDEQVAGPLPLYMKIAAPLTKEEMRDLADQHGIAPEILRDWSVVRLVLNSFGWLAKRVGDYSVPEHCIIYLVLGAEPALPGANNLGLLGIKGMVALRGTKLEARRGKSWTSGFTQVDTATMAEGLEGYRKLLAGIRPTEQEEASGGNVVGV